MQYCRFCGAEAPNDARFCGYCGLTLTDMAKGPVETVPASGYHPPQQTPPTAPIPFYEQQQSFHSASSRPISQAHGLVARLMAGKRAKWVLLLGTVIMVLVIIVIGLVFMNTIWPILVVSSIR